MDSSVKCCVITPVGPGHEAAHKQARLSVQRAFLMNPGSIAELVYPDLPDPHGKYGRSNRRNLGIDIAQREGCEWILFLDADDLLEPGAFGLLSAHDKEVDALWGAILETKGNGKAALRPNQVMPIKDISQILQADPYLTLQMGHFVRTSIAADIRFDERMDTGEDFKYYLEVWKRAKCLKADIPIFVNRRGNHSKGPRSADGADWRDAVSRVFLEFRIANKGLATKSGTRRKARSARHIVLTGYSRSGTTMLYNMLRSSVAGMSFLDDEYPAAQYIGDRRRSYVTKRPLDIFDLRNIFAANIHNKSLDFIILVRDPRSLVTSFHKSVKTDYFIGYDHQFFVPPQGEPQFVNPGLIRTHMAISQFLNAQLPCRRYLCRYEDLVCHTDRIQEQLGLALDLSYKALFTDFHRGHIPEALQGPLNGIRAVDSSGLGRWRSEEHFQRIKQQFNACPQLLDIVRAYGYETDDAWFEPYCGVAQVPSAQITNTP